MKELREKPELTDLEKADCLTGKMIGGIALKAPCWGAGMRRRFVFSDRASCYHVMSRVAGGDLLFGDIEKEAFRKLMRRMERFSCARVTGKQYRIGILGVGRRGADEATTQKNRADGLGGGRLPDR